MCKCLCVHMCVHVCVSTCAFVSSEKQDRMGQCSQKMQLQSQILSLAQWSSRARAAAGKQQHTNFSCNISSGSQGSVALVLHTKIADKLLCNRWHQHNNLQQHHCQQKLPLQASQLHQCQQQQAVRLCSRGSISACLLQAHVHNWHAHHTHIHTHTHTYIDALVIIVCCFVLVNIELAMGMM